MDDPLIPCQRCKRPGGSAYRGWQLLCARCQSADEREWDDRCCAECGHPQRVHGDRALASCTKAVGLSHVSLYRNKTVCGCPGWVAP